MKIYVASSWRNTYQPEIVVALRVAGHDVYDFKQPVPGDEGFHWSEIDGGWKNWSVSEYAQALDHPIAARGFASDMGALDAADLVVLVLPSGRSASWEYGWWCGKTKKQGIVHCPEKVEPELMYRGSKFTWTVEGLVSTVDRWARKHDDSLSFEYAEISGEANRKVVSGVVQELKRFEPTPNLPLEVWKAIGRLVVQPAVEVVIEDQHGGTLLTRRKDQHWDGWHVPGGFMSPGESIQEACTRTALRELGADVKLNEVLDVVAWPSHPYAATVSLFCSCSLVELGSLGGILDRLRNDVCIGRAFDMETNMLSLLPVHDDFLRRRARRGRGQ